VIFMDGVGKRVAESFDGEGIEQSAELCVTYSTATPPIQNLVSNGDDENASADGRTTKSDLTKVSEAIKIYPNPTRGGINLAFQSEQATDVQLYIQNVDGKLMRSESFAAESGGNVLSLLELSLPNGVYVARLLVGGEWRSEKFVVVK
ncbi:MAG: T9SS type A sorting domain-containing protein, partial [Saprospiraceae bacterium]